MSAYALPTVETWFSLLRSTISPQALIEAAQRRKMSALGIVDHATTLGHVPLAKAARDSGIHIVYGAALTLDDGSRLRVLARNDTGYRNLCRMVSLQAGGQARLPWQTVHDHRSGLYLLCGGRQGRLWQALAAGEDRVEWLLARLQALAERDDAFLIEAQQFWTDGEAEQRTLQQLVELAQRCGVRAVATHDVQVLHPSEGSKHRLVAAIDHQLSFWSDDERLPPWRSKEPSRYSLPETDSWHRRWNGLEHLVAGSAAVLSDCEVELLGRRRFPGASLQAARIYDDLWSRAFNGLKQRYGQVRPDLIQRLTHEVDEVMAQEVGPFLLHAAELVERAAAKGIKMVLQGSGTGSLLCYALGISPVDPLTSEALVFERFAGRHRGIGDLPDLDFGLPAGREGEVRDLLREMFGAERVTFLSAVVTLRERGAIRTAASAFGWDREQIRLLREKLNEGIELDRHEQMVVNAGREIAGQPYHLMRHPSGVIIAEEPLTSLYGVGVCSEGPMLHANKDDVEALQLLKFDILPWYLLAIFDQAEASIHAATYPKPDLWHVPGTDSRVGDMLEQADTRCIPYLQSPAMMTIMRALKVRTEADIALALGALRPGASHTRERLMAAIHGGSAVLPGWERLTLEHQTAIDAVLAPSRGALIYDEDLLRVAHLLGLSFADAERLRKVMGKGATDGPLINQLRAAAISNGWSDREIDVVLHWFQFIQRYTFTKGHAVAMAHAAWRVARLAVYYPVHFYAGVLDNLGLGTGGGMYPTLVYVVEARRHGIDVLGPRINGPWSSQPHGLAVQCGLRVLRGSITEATLQRIHDAARLRPFTGVADLCNRLDLSPADIGRLIQAGTLDEFAPSRRHARWEAHFAYGHSQDQISLLDASSWPEPPILDAESPAERAAEEYATLGFTLSLDHPLALVGDQLADLHLVQSAALRNFIGRRVQVAGVIVAGRRIHTQSGKLMTFASLCDAVGTIELTLFEPVTARYSDELYEGGLIVVGGIVSDHPEHGIGLDVRMVRRVALLSAERHIPELDPELVL